MSMNSKDLGIYARAIGKINTQVKQKHNLPIAIKCNYSHPASQSIHDWLAMRGQSTAPLLRGGALVAQ